MINNVSFPKLNWSFDVNRVLISGLFGRDVYWYGIIIGFGFLLAALYGFKRAKSFGLTADNIMDVLIWATPFSVVGARIYYVIFNLDAFKGKDFMDYVAFWDGGIAIYGAIIGAVTTAIIVCKLKKINIPNMFDLGALGLLIGQMIGRWGNFFNAEAFGVEMKSNLPWGMAIDFGEVVHPNFLYESLWNLLGFVILHFYSKHRKFKGEIFILYIAWYGLGRGMIEGLRGGDALMLFNSSLKVSQVLGYITLLVAAGVLVYNYIFRHHDRAEAALVCNKKTKANKLNKDSTEDVEVAKVSETKEDSVIEKAEISEKAPEEEESE